MIRTYNDSGRGAAELPASALDQIRMQYNYDVNDSTSYVDASQIPNEILFQYFAGIVFYPSDFGDYSNWDNI